ncbi:MAG TPA: histidine phosphatase family protein [Puia sp.]|nr:histidine phosphatase family protein [Puia sp.]
MKTILLIRHAKSSWNDPSLGDFDRPLNERGKKDALVMARRLVKNQIPIDLLVSSPAKRALSTAKLFAEELKKNKNDILSIPELYQAEPSVFTEVIARLDDSCQHAAIFAHNPGITAFANSLAEVHVDDMPTCSVFAVQANTGSWSAFEFSEKHFLFFDYPKSEAHH